MLSDAMQGWVPQGMWVDEGTPAYQPWVRLANEDVGREVIHEVRLSMMRGAGAWPTLLGVDRVAVELARLRGAPVPGDADLKGAFSLIATRTVGQWMQENLPESWDRYAPTDPTVRSALRAYAFGLPCWDSPPAWWLALESGSGYATLLTVRKVAMWLAAPEMARLGFGIHKPASAFVHLEALAPAYQKGGFAAWIRAALETLPWLPMYEKYLWASAEEDSARPALGLLDSLSRAVARRWKNESGALCGRVS